MVITITTSAKSTYGANKWVKNLTLVGVPSPLKTEVSHDSHWLGCLKPVPVSEYLNLILVSKKTLFFSRGEYFYFIWKTCKNIWILVLFVQKYSCWCFSCKNNHWDSFRAKILVFIVCFNSATPKFLILLLCLDFNMFMKKGGCIS